MSKVPALRFPTTRSHRPVCEVSLSYVGTKSLLRPYFSVSSLCPRRN